MKVQNDKYITQPEIRKRLLGGELTEPITVTDEKLSTDGVVKAGSPLDANGEIANTGDAKGILLNDVFEENPNGTILSAFGEVNKAVAESWSGITYTAAMMSALGNIKFQ
jgi:hypothetical protein